MISQVQREYERAFYSRIDASIHVHSVNGKIDSFEWIGGTVIGVSWEIYSQTEMRLERVGDEWYTSVGEFRLRLLTTDTEHRILIFERVRD